MQDSDAFFIYSDGIHSVYVTSYRCVLRGWVEPFKASAGVLLPQGLVAECVPVHDQESSIDKVVTLKRTSWL